MELFGMEKLSLVDYDGKVAATLFTGACNFRCGFCHNSPLVTCLNTLSPLNEAEVMDYLIARKKILEGVCISGGEPTLNKDLPKFAEKIKKIGYSVKIDTNGTNPEMIKTLHENGLADYFAMDVKNSPDAYSEIIGVKNFDVTPVSKSIEYLITNVPDYEFRTTLISKYHKEENVLSIGKWINGAKKYCLQKFRASENCISQGLDGVDKPTAERYVNLLKAYVQNTNLRGYD